MSNSQPRITGSTLCFYAVLAAYITLRIVAWQNIVLFENNDSLHYLDDIKTFLTFDLQKIIDLSPLSTPLYPFFGALASLPGWSVETGARLTSLLFSIALFPAVWAIGRIIANPLEVTLGVLVLAFSPPLIALSPAVLTEPSYVALIYIGLWLFCSQYKNPKPREAAIMGCIFGLAFLTRAEGILYLAFIPFIQGIYFFWEGHKTITLKKISYCGLVFVICFSCLAIPQIWRVSHKIGAFAINARQLWGTYLSIPDERSHLEKLFGLDFSPSQTNIKYIQTNPSVLSQLSTKAGPVGHRERIKNIIKNFDQLYQIKLGLLIGPIGFMFFGFGLISLYQSRYRFEIFLIIVFIFLNLWLSLKPSVIKMRYLIIVAPIIYLLEGIGIVYISRTLLGENRHSYIKKYLLPILFLLVLIACWTVPLNESIRRPPSRNRDYSPSEIIEPVTIMKNIADRELQRPPIVTSQRRVIEYFVDGKHYYLPYTNYEGLIRYCDLNNIDFIYLKYNRLKNYPFLKKFLDGEIGTELKLIFSGIDAYGGKIELYQLSVTKIEPK
jgi:4-amino-4-deoxy-L-arabinose transferase-like glycosyltransferase